MFGLATKNNIFHSHSTTADTYLSLRSQAQVKTIKTNTGIVKIYAQPGSKKRIMSILMQQTVDLHLHLSSQDHNKTIKTNTEIGLFGLAAKKEYCPQSFYSSRQQTLHLHLRSQNHIKTIKTSNGIVTTFTLAAIKNIFHSTL